MIFYFAALLVRLYQNYVRLKLINLPTTKNTFLDHNHHGSTGTIFYFTALLLRLYQNYVWLQPINLPPKKIPVEEHGITERWITQNGNAQLVLTDNSQLVSLVKPILFLHSFVPLQEPQRCYILSWMLTSLQQQIQSKGRYGSLSQQESFPCNASLLCPPRQMIAHLVRLFKNTNDVGVICLAR